jgi:PHP domain
MGHDHPHDSHGHSHDHSHGDGHSHVRDLGGDLHPALDESIPDSELKPADLGRRSFFRRAGILCAGAAAVSVVGSAVPAAAQGTPTERRAYRGGYAWLSGDHHIHTQYSSDAMYRVVDHVQHAAAYGLDWMVITDHGSIQHARIGVDKVNPDIVEARKAFDDEILVFQGVEWNIPSAEHGTVFVHPGKNEVAVLKEFENSFDGVVTGATASSPANEAVALSGLDFLATSVTSGRVKAALFLANHPARKGLDSPHEIRGWRDRQPGIAIGMEGAPGHQAAGMPKPFGAGSGRGGYDNSPTADSFAAYPPESYVTWGGFDWMTATVGGLWDSLLAEGKPWWITANSDSHNVWLEDAVRGPNSDFTTNGFYNDPVHGTAGPLLTNSDFWPGYYSRTHVGATGYSYAAVMAGLKAGRVWVDHGRLLDSLDVRVRTVGTRNDATLGSVLQPRKGRKLQLVITLETATLPNWAQFVPALAKVDIVRGAVTGPVSDRDVFSTPATSVVKTFDVSGRTGSIELVYDLGPADQPFYLRVRGSDGKRTQVGLNGAAVDPAGPAVDALGNADPWQDLWFYTNPIWVLPRR